jgi:hypothetical protein
MREEGGGIRDKGRGESADHDYTFLVRKGMTTSPYHSTVIVDTFSLDSPFQQNRYQLPPQPNRDLSFFTDVIKCHHPRFSLSQKL